MCLIRYIAANLHFEAWAEQAAIADCSCVVPDFDDVKLTFGRDRDAYHAVIVLFEHFVGKAVDDAIFEDFVSIRGVHLLGPSAALIVFGNIPEGAISLAHKEEHSSIPAGEWNGLQQRPEVVNRLDLHNRGIAALRVIRIVGIVKPKKPSHFVMNEYIFVKN